MRIPEKIDADMQKIELPSGRLFWGLSFVYASLMALMFQKLVLPLTPSLHAGHGLLYNDPWVFHTMAVEMANRIREHGWGEWKLYPGGGAGGNVALLSALYVFFGPDPASFIPFNAAAHATGALLLYKIGSRFHPGPFGAVGGLVGGFLYLIFPSALQWYGQNLKDAFAIAGVLMVLYAHLEAYMNPSPRMRMLLPLTVAAALLLFIVRPYFIVVALVGLIIAWLGCVFFAVVTRDLVAKWRQFLRGAILLAGLGVVASFATHILPTTTSPFEGGAVSEGSEALVTSTGWKWHRTAWLPTIVDRTFEHAAETRALFVAYNRSVSAGSGIDEDRLPGDALGVIAYLPRALAISLFSPFPSSWGERVSAPRLVGAIETSIWYLFFPGIFLLFIRRPSYNIVFAVLFGASILTLLGFVHPNVGTVYRQRFAYWMLALTIGAVGWASVLMPRLTGTTRHRQVAPSASLASAADTGDQKVGGGLDMVVAAGAIVMIITLICHLGFVARDLLLVREFGVSTRLDAYFFAAMLPMFFVTSFAMPMADALMRYFVELHIGEGLAPSNRLVRQILWHAAIWLAIVAVALGITARPLMRLGLENANTTELAEATALFRCFLPILVFSAWTVIGNAVLNALHHYRSAASAQMVVPVVAILSILTAPAEFGFYPAVFGMVFGTLLNAGLIFWRLSRLGILLWPSYTPMRELPPMMVRIYRQLALIGLVGAAATPLGYALAGQAGAGGISIWALTSKIIVLIGGLASVGVGSIILPRLSRLLREHFALLRNNILALLFGGTWLGGGIAALLCLFSVPIVSILLGDAASEDRLSTFVEVLHIGALQIPVLIAYTVMTKTSGVMGTSGRALAGSVLGLAAYFCVAYLSVDRFGVIGISAAALSAVALSTVYLSIMVRQASGLGVTEVAVLILGWLVWIGVCFAVIAGGFVTLLCASIGLIGLAWVQIRVLAAVPAAD